MDVYKNINCRNVSVNNDYLWNFLMFSGILKPVRIYRGEDLQMRAELMITNDKISEVFRKLAEDSCG